MAIAYVMGMVIIIIRIRIISSQAPTSINPRYGFAKIRRRFNEYTEVGLRELAILNDSLRFILVPIVR